MELDVGLEGEKKCEWGRIWNFKSTKSSLAIQPNRVSVWSDSEEVERCFHNAQLEEAADRFRELTITTSFECANHGVRVSQIRSRLVQRNGQNDIVKRELH